MAHDLRIVIGPVDADLKRVQTVHASPSLGMGAFARADFRAGFDLNEEQAPAITLGNVIPFRGRKEPEQQNAPSVLVEPSERPAPLLAKLGGPWKVALLLAISIIAHAAIFVVFNRPAPPKASIGLEVITVELELGAKTVAGQAEKPSQSQETQDSAAAEANTEPPTVEETKEAEVKQEVAVAPPVADETPEPVKSEPKKLPEPPRPPVAETKPKPTPPAPRAEPKKEKKHTTSPVDSTNSKASSGVGRGRSDADANYKGIAFAHLSRFASGRDVQGSGRVAFKLDGNGRVTSVKVVGSPGVESFDRAAIAMVQRASPFPPPPGGRAIDIVAPVTFR